ncbi:MAG: hypothetical protein ACRD10_10710 [Terriglobia bacterium]
MENPFGNLNVVKNWKAGDTRELSENVLKQARIDGLYDSYAQLYELDGARWKVRDQVSKPGGETVYTVVCVNG